MSRTFVGMLAAILCVAPISYSYQESKDVSKDMQAAQGLWIGSYGGGQRDGVFFQPAFAEVFIKGEHIEISGYPTTVAGKFRLDSKTKKLIVTPAEKAEATYFGYEIAGDKFTLRAGERSITFDKREMVSNPLANAQIELVLADGINPAGDLLVTEFTEKQLGQERATYFEPQKRALRTKQAAVLVVEKAGCKKIDLTEARGLIRGATPVVITYRMDERPPWDPGLRLSKVVGSPTPDGQAVGQMLSRVLQPGTLVFVLSAKENAAMP